MVYEDLLARENSSKCQVSPVTVMYRQSRVAGAIKEEDTIVWKSIRVQTLS